MIDWYQSNRLGFGGKKKKEAGYVLQNKEQTLLLAHRAIMFPNYVRRCLILPVPNSLTVACPFLDQYSPQWYHTGQEKPENKKQKMLLETQFGSGRCFWRTETAVSIVNLKMSTQQPFSSWFGKFIHICIYPESNRNMTLDKAIAWLHIITSISSCSRVHKQQ